MRVQIVKTVRKKHFLALMLFTFLVNLPFSKAKDYNILDFGAIKSSTVLSTKAINMAIDQCSKDGGGTVVIPAGEFLSGTIFMKSHVNLYLESGAYLFASKNLSDFPRLPQSTYKSLKDIGGWYALIYAEKEKYISITGLGIIDGQGKGRKGVPGGLGGDVDGRPRNILFISCSNVTVTDITLNNSAIWNQHYLDCEDVLVDRIKVFNHCNGNNDGIDIDGCRRMVLSNSIIDSDDDGIVLKSTGLSPCEDIAITNCIVSSFANAIKCGTESTGGFKNIVVSNCIIKPSRSKGKSIVNISPNGITGISLEIVDGGIMNGVSISNIIIEGTSCPLYVRLANRARKYHLEADTPKVGEIKNIQISNITAYNTGNFCSSITGIAGQKIENISLTNIQFYNVGGLKEGSYRNVNLDEISKHDRTGILPNSYLKDFRNVVEDDKGYPQPSVWQNLPCYGLFIRHVKNISLTNSTFIPQNDDPRPSFIAVDVETLKIKDVSLVTKKKASIVINQVKTLYVDKTLKVYRDRSHNSKG